MITPADSYPDPHQDVYSKTIFGFWVYLLTDFMMFTTLFITYAVLHNNTFGGPSAHDLFSLPFTLTQTLILLTSSFTIALGGAFAHRSSKNWTIALFGITFLLGIAFVWMEFSELLYLFQGGNSWHKSAFLSVFFTLVGTYLIHMLFALLWIIVFLLPVWMKGLTPESVRRLTCLRMFWQFLNIVWILIFTIVYLMGVK